MFKKVIQIVIVVFAVLSFLPGCSYSYRTAVRNMGMTKIGKPLPSDASAYRFEKARESANLGKLQAEPVYGDSVRGYIGYIWNEQIKGVSYEIYDPDGIKVAQGFLSPRNRDGCEHKKYLMPTSRLREYLVVVKTTTGTFSSSFAVSSLVDDIGTKKGHWHVRVKQKG